MNGYEYRLATNFHEWTRKNTMQPQLVSVTTVGEHNEYEKDRLAADEHR